MITGHKKWKKEMMINALIYFQKSVLNEYLGFNVQNLNDFTYLFIMKRTY